MLNAIPAMPVLDIERSIEFYRDKLGFALAVRKEGWARLTRDEVAVELWTANDEAWRERQTGPCPVISGAESFIAGTASFRVEVTGVDALHRTLEHMGIIHPRGQLQDEPWGIRDFAVLDPDNNLISFFEKLTALSAGK